MGSAESKREQNARYGVRFAYILVAMQATDIRIAYDDIADALSKEHRDELASIEEAALALKRSIAERAADSKKASVLDRLFKRTV